MDQADDENCAECQECLEVFPVEELTPRPVIGHICDDCLYADEDDDDDG